MNCKRGCVNLRNQTLYLISIYARFMFPGSRRILHLCPILFNRSLDIYLLFIDLEDEVRVSGCISHGLCDFSSISVAFRSFHPRFLVNRAVEYARTTEAQNIGQVDHFFAIFQLFEIRIACGASKPNGRLTALSLLSRLSPRLPYPGSIGARGRRI